MECTNKHAIENDSKEMDQSFQDKHNLVGFFALLLEVDQRINPQIYKDIRSDNDHIKIE